MPPQRRLLALISENGALGEHLSPYARGLLLVKLLQAHDPLKSQQSLISNIRQYYAQYKTTSSATKANPSLALLERNHTLKQTNDFYYATFDYTLRIHMHRLE
ncbi:hypothetical protein IFR05_015409 [Cadophora sp. M221]|nr:hypothetical protein IFR05_015409 [Cadophora sp. M221]